MSIQLELPDSFKTLLQQSIEEVYKEAITNARRDIGLSREYLTIPETMDLMQISRNTLTDWFEKGLPKYRIGNKQYVKKSEIDKFLMKYEV